MSFQTPILSHIKPMDYEQVYEPAEDTFLFLDALESENEFIKELNPTLVLEIGSGTGVVSTFLSAILGPRTIYLCTDINEKAAALTAATGRTNDVTLEPVVTDLVRCMKLSGKVDVLLFNPPYVVTDLSEVGSHGIAASWAGGPDGRAVTDLLLPQVNDLLSSQGAFYLIVLKENKPEEIADILDRQGFSCQHVMSRRTGPEHLSVLRFVRRTAHVVVNSRT